MTKVRSASSTAGSTVRLLTAVCLMTAAFVETSRAQQDCASMVAQLQEKERAGDLVSIDRLGNEIKGSVACDPALRESIGRRIAIAHVREAQRMGSQSPVAARLQVLERGTAFAMSWPLMQMIGDLQLEGPNGKPDFRAASEAYRAALSDIKDEKKVPKPPEEVIKRLIALSQQVRLASNEFIPGSDLSTRDVRGVAVVGVPVPVKFNRDSDVMTPDGTKYADEAAKQLKAMGQPTIRLIGHTDPDGTDDYNQKLSVRRAQAMKRFLVERGYPDASIQAEGRGRSQPLKVIDEKQFNKDQLFEIQRRVEVQFP